MHITSYQKTEDKTKKINVGYNLKIVRHCLKNFESALLVLGVFTQKIKIVFRALLLSKKTRRKTYNQTIFSLLHLSQLLKAFQIEGYQYY